MKVFRNLFSKTEPTEFSENKMQVNLNIAPTTREEQGESINGYRYDTVVFEETDCNYTDFDRIQVAIVFEAQELLDSTQWKFGDDYDKKGTPEYLELKAKRQEARNRIRTIRGN